MPSMISKSTMDARGLPTELYCAAQVRELDRLAIENGGIAGIDLMNRAGYVAFSALQKRWPNVCRVVVLCGSGNNGGDGFVVARLARESGLDVEVYRPQGASEPRGDALLALHAWRSDGGVVNFFTPDVLNPPCVVVDGLLGTGIEKDVSDVYANVVASVNRSGCPVLSLDIPSGLHADTGMPMGIAIRAAMTVTFVGLKRGLFTGLAADFTGKVLFDSLGIPKECYDRVPAKVVRISRDEVRSALPPRRRCIHKGDNGHALIIGGESGMLGAACMAASGAAKVGAGLVSVATREIHAGLVSLRQPEIMAHGVEDGAALKHLLERANVLAIGPGLGRGEWGRALFNTIVSSTRHPLVVDADALNLLAEQPQQSERWVLTPHPGEAARLLGCTVTEVQADRFVSVRRLQERYGGVVILKGAGSVVASKDEHLGLCALGNPGMASGGMGDVLTGVIAGLLAQGVGMEKAARVGVYLHALAADRAAKEGERGLLATDLLPHLRQLANPCPA